jgi:hypothetical protein
MTSFVMKGALIEYASDFLGPLPNVVVFQFNPEQITRTMMIPQRPTGAGARETSQAGDQPVEQIQMTIQLTADDDLMPPFVKTLGILPPLAALEKMVRPKGPIFGANLAVDAVGSAVDAALSSDGPVQIIPRENYPRLLFVWGLTRLLPVEIHSMQITEKQYDFLLNPTLADVQLGLNVIVPDVDLSDDPIANGASKFSEGALEVAAAINLGFALREVIDLVHF